MIALHSPRLVALFGNIPLEQLTADDIERAVQRGDLHEDDDLDFKERIEFDKGDAMVKEEAKAEFAKDVAAFANAHGGLILVGVHETEGVADGVNLLDLNEDFPARLWAAAASNLAPVAEFRVHFTPKATDPKRGFYIISVPRSPSAPHAVRLPRKNHAWRFPRRVGHDTHFMHESEIADAYRNRFQGMEEQSSRLGTVLANGKLQLHPIYGWACMALVPNAPGRVTLDQKRMRSLATWAATVSDIPPSSGPFKQVTLNPSTRAGRITLSVLQVHESARPYAELYADGSGFVAVPVFHGDPRASEIEIHAVSLVQRTYGLVSLLMGHATSNVGLVGDAVCAFELCSTRPQPMRMKLVYSEDGVSEMIYGSRPLLSAPVSQRTVSLAALMHGAQECVATTHMLLSDLFAEFGVPEGRYLAPDGTLRLKRWGLTRANKALVEKWAQQNGVPTSSEDVED
jgi:hypothetical protein